MGYEYVVSLPRGVEHSTVASALLRKLPLSIIENSNQRMTLRWSEAPERQSWPEDVELHFEASTVIVNFPLGVGLAERNVLEVVASTISTVVGVPVTFDEA